MLELSACCAISAQQGGLCMSAHLSSSQKQVAPGQVWPALSRDLRTRVIGLLAQLALNMALARLGNGCAGKEGADVEPTIGPKNPS